MCCGVVRLLGFQAELSAQALLLEPRIVTAHVVLTARLGFKHTRSFGQSFLGWG